MTQIDSTYNAKAHEERLYQEWESQGHFKPAMSAGLKPFSIALPPPNATGELHLGHATMLAIEDVMVRYQRMVGRPSLWVPGTDHAAIATQNKVEKLIAEEGLSRHDLGREAFLERVKTFVANSQDTIRNQMRKMGASVDWSHERYTMDEGLSHAVRTAFVRLYEAGLIYRGHRIVNWCVRCQSTLADDEVEYREEKTKFYYIKYGPVVIGTARPETKFHDKVIIVHPDDERYKGWVGKSLMVPWINGEVRATFVADEAADIELGSGAMTITPAHSFVDFELAQKHGFEVIQIIDEQGKITTQGGPDFEGMTSREAREKVAQVLEEKGLMDHVDENYVHNLSICYRCDTPIEPLVSEQWFINVNKQVNGKSMKDRALDVVRNGEIKILPERFNKVYFHWMENLRDWCISRQIWWGHQIPVWTCANEKRCTNPIVATETPTACPQCGGAELLQDPDTLDTWFSSGLWTFSTLGWPETTEELKRFHPTSVLETGYDILFFWVARMILLSTTLMDEIPFETVYLHGLVRDKEGRKMSKSLGNGIDPLDMIEKYGTDAVRLSLILGSSPGNDLRLYEEKIAGYRNFVNKIWNGARFVLMNLEKADFNTPIDPKALSRADRWILHRTNALIQESTEGLSVYRLSEIGTRIYDFFWSEFCDWYVEMSKVKPNKPVLAHVLKTVLTLLHPFTPFVTEALWKQLDQPNPLIISAWPKANKGHEFPEAEKEIALLIQTITAIRQLRADNQVEAGRRIPAQLHGQEWTDALTETLDILKQMARMGEITLVKSGPKPENALSAFVGSIEIYLPMEGVIDKDKEKVRLDKEIANLKNYLKGLEAKLNNPGYLAGAPTDVMAQDQDRAREAREKCQNLEAQRLALGE